MIGDGEDILRETFLPILIPVIKTFIHLISSSIPAYSSLGSHGLLEPIPAHYGERQGYTPDGRQPIVGHTHHSLTHSHLGAI